VCSGLKAVARPLNPSFAISVRNLVELVLRSGDLSAEFRGSASAIEGIRAHQRIQRQRPAGYEAEVPVQVRVELAGVALDIGGRIDGVFPDAEPVVIEEIKSTLRSLKEIEAEPNEIHWAQAQCYAYMYARQEGLAEVDIQLTYLQLESERTLTLMRRFEVDALAIFFDDLVARYRQWVQWRFDWSRVRDRSLAALPFPYGAYRPGQRDMAVAVFRTIRDSGQLISQAATGIGKTMAVLYPTLKALGQGSTRKVIFLTARTTGRLAAQTALAELADAGMRLKWMCLTAKDKICFSPDSACSPDECPYAKGFFDRLNPAILAALDHDALERDTIEHLARDFQVCPFEFSLELVDWSDCIIADYNYAFDPTVRLKRLFEEGGRHDTLLVDEAHNLVDRSRQMFSADLNKQAVLELRGALKQEQPRMYKALGRVNAWLAALRKRCQEAGGTRVDADPPQGLVDRVRAFLKMADRWLRLNEPKAYRDGLLQFYFDSSRFVRVAENYSKAYATVAEARGRDLRVRLFCIDPSDQLIECWRRCRAAVFFSATLTPVDYFQSVLGISPDAGRLDLVSPFPTAHLAVFAATGISTLYRRREISRSAVSRAIADMVLQREGHYLFFFPSYEYLSMIRETFCDSHPDVDVIVQSSDMDEASRERFLARFTDRVERTLVGFAVMGGIFGEGIDLKGECLTGAAIVGVGLPGIDTERELIKAYYDLNGRRGFEYAYQYPGINRVLQAAGRVIRSETDRGVVLLIDERYAQRRYRTLLPANWQVRTLADLSRFKTLLNDFWDHSA